MAQKLAGNLERLRESLALTLSINGRIVPGFFADREMLETLQLLCKLGASMASLLSPEEMSVALRRMIAECKEASAAEAPPAPNDEPDAPPKNPPGARPDQAPDRAPQPGMLALQESDFDLDFSPEALRKRGGRVTTLPPHAWRYPLLPCPAPPAVDPTTAPAWAQDLTSDELIEHTLDAQDHFLKGPLHCHTTFYEMLWRYEEECARRGLFTHNPYSPTAVAAPRLYLTRAPSFPGGPGR